MADIIESSATGSLGLFASFALSLVNNALRCICDTQLYFIFRYMESLWHQMKFLWVEVRDVFLNRICVSQSRMVGIVQRFSGSSFRIYRGVRDGSQSYQMF